MFAKPTLLVRKPKPRQQGTFAEHTLLLRTRADFRFRLRILRPLASHLAALLVRMPIVLLACVVIAGFSMFGNAQEVQLSKTPGGVEYGTWGKTADYPAPIVFVLSGTIKGTLESKYFRQSGNELSELGYLLVSIDIPCHGTQTGEGKPSGLGGWGIRAEKGEDFVAEFNARLCDVLDHLIKSGVANPEKIAICGTSRGGFLAVHFAAHDPRVKCAAAFAPVTDPAALSEFKGKEDLPLTKKLSLINQAEKLAGRAVWIVIGDQDARVSTQAAIDVAQAITKASIGKKMDSKVELRVMPEPRGHSTPKGSAEAAAKWIHTQIFPEEVKKPTDISTAKKPANRHILFIDDHDVLYRSGTKRVFHPAKTNPTNPIVKEDKAWEMAIGWTSIYRHPETGKYQLWYQAYGGGRDPRKTHKCVVCYAESDDGITFTKPSLGIYDFDGVRSGVGMIKDTNIVLLGDGGYGDRYANSVIYDERETDQKKRYKMLYTDFGPDDSGQEWPGFYAAFSPDGIHWTKSKKNPLNHTAYGGRSLQPPFSDENVYSDKWDERKKFTRKMWTIPLSMSDAADVIYDPNHKKFVAYGKSWIQGPAGGLAWKHAMARVESDDFLNWSKPEILSWPDDFDPPNTEYHTSPVFFHKGVYFSLNQILSARGEAIGAKADAMHIELMTSRDGLKWERNFREEPFIASKEQAFSNGGIFTNSTPVILEDEMRFYYGGYNSGTIGGGAKLTDPSQQSGVGFAAIELDRIAGIRPVALSAQSTLKRPLENIGQVTLKPIAFDGLKNIIINADASAGEIRVEILNEDGYRMRGFSKDDAEPITNDGLKNLAKWKSGSIESLPLGRYSIRLHLDNAEVFAVSLK